MVSVLLFKRGKADFSPWAQGSLDEAIANARDLHPAYIRIDGFRGHDDPPVRALDVAWSRANAVAQTFSEHGFDRGHLIGSAHREVPDWPSQFPRPEPEGLRVWERRVEIVLRGNDGSVLLR